MHHQPPPTQSTEPKKAENYLHPPIKQNAENFIPQIIPTMMDNNFMFPNNNFIMQDKMYHLILSQLLIDGFIPFAQNFAQALNIDINTVVPSYELLNICMSKFQTDINSKVIDTRPKKPISTVVATNDQLDIDIDLFNKDQKNKISESVEIKKYRTIYVTSHKGACVKVKYSDNGRFIATGSTDSSVKLLDTEKMLLKASETKLEKQANEIKEEESLAAQNHPVIKTIYDHIGTIHGIDFHPNNTILATGGDDKIVNFFEFSRSFTKKSSKVINETEPITNIKFHPCGTFLAVLTTHPTIRIYDLNTLSCYTSCNPRDQHLSRVNSIHYSVTGKVYVSGSADGSIKLWDGISGRCYNTIAKAHTGTQVMSVILSKSGNSFLSSGQDNLVKLWDIRSIEQPLLTINVPSQQNNNINPAIFNHTEDYIIFIEDNNYGIGYCNVKTGFKADSFNTGHSNVIRHIAHSPVNTNMITCSDDFRGRYWYFGQF